MLRIEPFSHRYLAQYCELYQATWQAEPYGESFTAEEITRHLSVNEGFLYLLIRGEHDEDVVVGFVGGRPLAHECNFFDNAAEPSVEVASGFYIDELGVHEELRRHGFGGSLTLFLMSVARSRGFNAFVLRTHAAKDNPASRLYSRLGFATRRTAAGELHGVDTKQRRVDDRDEVDRRIYYYKNIGRATA